MTPVFTIQVRTGDITHAQLKAILDAMNNNGLVLELVQVNR